MYTYTDVGNLETTTISGSGGKKIITSNGYSDDGNLLTSVTDASGATVTYTYGNANSKMLGLPTKVTAPNGTVTITEYDNYDRVTQTSVANRATLLYNYTNGYLSSITREDSQGKEQVYTLINDAFGKTTAIKVGSRLLASYEYGQNNGPLTKQTYGNGETVSYEYDHLGRVIKTTYSSGLVLTYAYTGEGYLYSVTETRGGESTRYLYTYDANGRVIGSERLDGGASVLRTRQSYDSVSRLDGQIWQIGEDTYSESYTYNSAIDGSLNTMTLKDGNSIIDILTMGYDGLRRLSTVSGSVYDKSFTYRDIINSSRTTSQIASVSYDLPVDQVFGYTYDVMGNIATYTDSNGTVTYTYDPQGQLLSASNGYSYTYDSVGNILTGNGHTYTYGDTQGWADLLTAVDGQSITYDAIGNPTSYYNGTRWFFTWTQERRLETASSISATEDMTISYRYNADGLRTGKTVVSSGHAHNYTVTLVPPTCTERGYTLRECRCGDCFRSEYVNALGHSYIKDLGQIVDYCVRCGAGRIELPPRPTEPGEEIMSSDENADASVNPASMVVIPTTVTEYDYIYAGSKLVRMIVTTTVDEGTPAVESLDFFYDANGNAYALKYNGTLYYYITNLQGDVMSIVDGSGNVVASYQYDPYGNVLTATGVLAETNPLRYRGYVYDTESTLYYLQSRYYDPEMGRFISADSYASTGQGILGNNMFAYCGNNSVKYCDRHGHSAKIAFDDGTNMSLAPWKNPMGGGGLFVAHGYVAFSGMKYAKDEDWRNFYSAAEQLLASGSISGAREAFRQLNQNEVFKYAKGGMKVRGGIKQIKSAVLVFLIPDPSLTDEIISTQLLGYGISNIVVGVFQIIERILNE